MPLTAQAEGFEQQLNEAKAEAEKWSKEAAKHEAALVAVRGQYGTLNDRITTLLERQAEGDERMTRTLMRARSAPLRCTFVASGLTGGITR